MDDWIRRFLTYFLLFVAPIVLIGFATIANFGGIAAMMGGMVWLGIGVFFATPRAGTA